MSTSASSGTLGGGPGLGAGGVAATTPLRPAITRTMLTVFVIGDVLGAGSGPVREIEPEKLVD